MPRLAVGLVNNDVYGEVLKEVLSHQGILFEEVTPKRKSIEKFPCVLLSTFSDESYRLAKRNCLDENGIIIVNEEIQLETILRGFAGESEDSGGYFSYPNLNDFELKLLETIKRVFFDRELAILRKWFWPNFQKACCVLTHDIDWLHYSPWHKAVFRRRTLPQLAKLAWNSIIRRRNYGNNIPALVKLEKEMGFRSSFYFLPGYYKNFKEFLSALDLLRKDHFEVGLHGYYSHDNLNKLLDQKKALEEHLGIEVKGTRQHGLKFKVPSTWEHEDKAGFLYDLTFHFNERFGFRPGICFPYHPFNMTKGTKLRILEMPTSVIDWTILRRNFSVQKAVETIRKAETTVEHYNGLLLTCFHNTYLNRETFPEVFEIFAQLLEDVHKNGFWVATSLECCLWWLEREKTKIQAKVRDNKIIGRTSKQGIPLLVEASEEKGFFKNEETTFEIDLRRMNRL